MNNTDNAATNPSEYPDDCDAAPVRGPRPTTRGSWRNNTPTRTVHVYPPAPDNPGRVSDGTARNLRNHAEVYHQGSHATAIAAMRSMADRQDRPKILRNQAKARRRARRANGGP